MTLRRETLHHAMQRVMVKKYGGHMATYEKDLLKKGYIWVWCPVCRESRLHRPVHITRHWTMGRRKKFKCCTCGNLSKF